MHLIVIFQEWDILDVPATKNVEIYNPEMDETKPPEEVMEPHDTVTATGFLLPDRQGAGQAAH